MKEIHTEIVIDAPAEKVWKVLTDFRVYPGWNPFIRRVEGEVKSGSRPYVSVEPSGGRKMSFRPTVMVVDSNRELRWRGHLGIPAIFNGEHLFLIQPHGEGRVRFIHEERFSGLLLPLVWKRLDSDTRRAFHEMNQALKVRSEAVN